MGRATRAALQRWDGGRGVAIAASIFLSVLSQSAAAVAAQPVVEVHYVMGTYLTLHIAGMPEEAARAAMRACFTEVRRLEAVFTHFEPGSELNRLNAAAGVGSFVLSADMRRLLERSLELRVATDGAFDVTVGAITAAWRDGNGVAPTRGAALGGAVAELRSPVWEGESAVLLPAGTRLDFDGVAKGYAVDRCVDLLRGRGVRNALVNFGESSLYALGSPPGKAAWSVRVRDADGKRIAGTLQLRDRAVSVSAVFGHAYGRGRARVGHIVDPVTGRPLADQALALVVAQFATDAEAYSKAVLIWGRRGTGRRWLRLSRSGVTAAMLTDSQRRGGWNLGAIAYREAVRPSPATWSEEPIR